MWRCSEVAEELLDFASPEAPPSFLHDLLTQLHRTYLDDACEIESLCDRLEIVSKIALWCLAWDESFAAAATDLGIDRWRFLSACLIGVPKRSRYVCQLMVEASSF